MFDHSYFNSALNLNESLPHHKSNNEELPQYYKNVIVSDELDQQTIEIESSCHDCRVHKIHRDHQKNVINNQQELIKSIEKRNLELEKVKSNVNKCLRDDQIKNLGVKDKTGHRYSNETIKDSIKLLITGGRNGYDTLRNLNYPFPSIRTIAKRTEHIKFKSGIHDEAFELLEMKIRPMLPEDKNCAVLLDEMAIKPSINYDNRTDSFVGKTTIPGHPQADASKALVFMLVGVGAVRWKTVVGYFFTPEGINGQVLGPIITDITKRASKIGLNPIVVNCDMGSSNVAMWN